MAQEKIKNKHILNENVFMNLFFKEEGFFVGMK